MKDKLTIGQSIFFKRRNHRGNIETDVIEAKIKTIGKKYFTVESTDKDNLQYERFYIETLNHDGGNYMPIYFGYLSKQDILDEKEKADGLALIRKTVGEYESSRVNLTLDQIRAILNIINPVVESVKETV